MQINVDAFLNSLPIMGKGMLGIFVVTLIIIVGIYIMNAVTKKRDKADAAGSEETKANE